MVLALERLINGKFSIKAGFPNYYSNLFVDSRKVFLAIWIIVFPKYWKLDIIQELRELSLNLAWVSIFHCLPKGALLPWEFWEVFSLKFLLPLTLNSKVLVLANSISYEARFLIKWLVRLPPFTEFSVVRFLRLCFFNVSLQAWRRSMNIPGLTISFQQFLSHSACRFLTRRHHGLIKRQTWLGGKVSKKFPKICKKRTPWSKQ